MRSLFQIILMITFHVAYGEYKFEGVNYIKNIETEVYYLAHPENVQYGNNGQKQIEWSLAWNETLKCACPAEDQKTKDSLASSSNSVILFEVNRDPCICSEKVEHSTGTGRELCGTSYDSHGFGFSIFKKKATDSSSEEKIMDLQKMSSSVENVIFLPVIRLCMHTSRSHFFTLSHQTKFIQPRKPQLNLSTFEQSTLDFDEIKYVQPYYNREQQYEDFKEIMNADMFTELTENDIYLVARQLIREEFMLLDNEKSATLFNFNLIPMWSNLADEWDEIQIAIVEVYKEREPINGLSVTLCGTYDKYKYSDIIDNTVKLTLYLQSPWEEYHIDVPYYHWILYWHEMNEVLMPIFIITHNDYHATQMESQERKLCHISLCHLMEKKLWDVIQKKENLLVYCCPYIPEVEDDSNIVKKLQLENFFDENGRFVVKRFESSKSEKEEN